MIASLDFASVCFQLIFSFHSFSLLAIYKTASLSLKCKLEGGLPTFTRFYIIFQFFLQYFSMFVNIFQYFIEKTGSLPSANWREDHLLFSKFYSIFQYFTVFFIIVQYFSVFSNIVQYLQYFSVYFRKDGVSQLQIGGRFAPFLQETLSREGL